MITISVDAMGGDFAPEQVVKGAEMAIIRDPDLQVILFGQEEAIARCQSLESHRVRVHPAKEVIDNTEAPAMAVRRKKEASIVQAVKSVKEGTSQAVVSAGSTGAAFTAGLFGLGRIQGINRPGIMPIMPTLSSKRPRLILMDGGANVECKPENIHEFALLANFYAKNMLKISAPIIGLLNNGTEAGKGNDLAQAAYKLLDQDETLNFYGNFEPHEVLEGKVDILVSDGFTMNIMMKTLEGSVASIMTFIKDTLKQGSLSTKLGASLIQSPLKEAVKAFDFAHIGGAVVLGLNHPLIITHGSANDLAIANSIRQAKDMVEAQVTSKTARYFKQES